MLQRNQPRLMLLELQNAVASDVNEEPQDESSDETDDDDDDDDADDDDGEIVDMSGVKCRAPYTHSWGEMSYHNAIILCCLPDQSQVHTLLSYM